MHTAMPGSRSNMVASAGESYRDLAGRQFPSRVLNIINLKLYNVL
jgi:hypothetical protein